jgi:hypothetical protein
MKFRLKGIYFKIKRIFILNIKLDNEQNKVAIQNIKEEILCQQELNLKQL